MNLETIEAEFKEAKADGAKGYMIQISAVEALIAEVKDLTARAEKAEEGCKTCKMRDTDSYRFYAYPCRECKHRARDSYEPIESGLQETGEEKK